MSARENCERVDEMRELAVGYMAGRLASEQAEAFEEHYFACDECWAAVEGTIEIRSGFEQPGRSSTRPVTRGQTGPSWRRWAAMAAAIVLLASGATVAVNAALGRFARNPDFAWRLDPQQRVGALYLGWSPHPSADTYRARLVTATGVVVHELLVSDTVLVVPHSDFVAPASGLPIYWQLEALDEDLDVISQTDLHNAMYLPR